MRLKCRVFGHLYRMHSVDGDVPPSPAQYLVEREGDPYIDAMTLNYGTEWRCVRCRHMHTIDCYPLERVRDAGEMVMV